MYRNLIRAHGEELGLDYQTLGETQGALGPHAIRTLFATYWVQRNAKWCQIMMHHLTLSLTTDLYDGSSEVSVELLADYGEPASVVDDITRLRQELKEAREELAALRAERSKTLLAVPALAG